mgnify:CR=1 FL=1
MAMFSHTAVISRPSHEVTLRDILMEVEKEHDIDSEMEEELEAPIIHEEQLEAGKTKF